MSLTIASRLAAVATAALFAVTVTSLGACGPQSGGAGLPDFAGGVDSGLGVPCPDPPADTDGDHISDENEGAYESPPRDTDHDGVPDFRDQDSDNDGIPDAIEGHNGNACTPPIDTDGDGVADFRDLDSDDANDSTIPDKIEAGASPTLPADTDGDGIPDYRDPDDDGDGILDIFEMTAQGAAKATSDPATVPDTDHDGIPDYLDLDSDGDTILDADELASDVDGDGIPNYRDLDSDNDCVSDAFEAGDTLLGTPPVDTDGDGAPDFVDVDSDNDGLVDNDEDLNCNGKLDTCETSRVLVDTDGDGVSDLVEHEACVAMSQAQQQQTMCACDGDDPNVTPATHGDFVFVVPFEQPPTPNLEVLSLSTDVHQADVLFAVDTTGSMQNCINNLAAGLSQLVSKVVAAVPDTAFGLFQFRDFGTPQDSASTNPPNVPSMQYVQRVETVSGAGLTTMQTGLTGLFAWGGGDGPEAGWSALWTLGTGTSDTIVVRPGTDYTLDTTPATLPLSTGETGGTIAGAGFRAGSVPIVVTVTDAEWHDAPGSAVAGDPESGLNPYPSTDGNGHPACNPCTNVPSRRQAITALQALGAHVIGLAAVGTETFGDPKTRALKAAQETGAVVTPADFGPVGTRPAGCPIDQCCTGLDANDNVIGEASQAGLCPLSFTVDDDTGGGVSDSVVSGIAALANALRFDVHVQAQDIDAGAVENFMLKLVPDLSGTGPASMCLTTAPSPLEDNFTGPLALPGPDGVLDTFPGLGGGNLICFDVVPKTNGTVQPTSQPQLYRAQLQVIGVSGTSSVNLGVPREVFFLVPPVIVNTPIQ